MENLLVTEFQTFTTTDSVRYARQQVGDGYGLLVRDTGERSMDCRTGPDCRALRNILCTLSRYIRRI